MCCFRLVFDGLLTINSFSTNLGIMNLGDREVVIENLQQNNCPVHTFRRTGKIAKFYFFIKLVEVIELTEKLKTRFTYSIPYAQVFTGFVNKWNFIHKRRG